MLLGYIFYTPLTKIIWNIEKYHSMVTIIEPAGIKLYYSSNTAKKQYLTYCYFCAAHLSI